MAAQVDLDWEYIEFGAAGVASWLALKKVVDLEDFPGLLSSRAVYVIRVARPFSFQYENGHSPVAYIGKGKAQQRITAHLKSWMADLSHTVPQLKVRIYFCEPRVPKLGRICEGVEADLVRRFVDRYGHRPLRNRNTPRKAGDRQYSQEQLHVLHPGKGVGFHWSLTPLPSSHFYRA